MLQILGAALMTTPLGIVMQCLIALGAPKHFPQFNAIRLASLFVFTLAGFHVFGFAGAVCGVVLSYFSWLPVATYYKIKYQIFDIRKELLVLPPLLLGMAAGKVFNIAVALWLPLLLAVFRSR
jgi:hypothetical protein